MSIDDMGTRVGYDADDRDFLITCDGKKCRESEELIEMSFLEMIGELKKKGWRITKVHGTWMHYCPDCDVKYP